MRRAVVIIIVVAIFIAYAVALFNNISYAAGGADTSGYLNLAKMLSRGRVSYVIEPIRQLGLSINEPRVRVFTPIGFTWGKSGTGTMAPGYPPGLPMHLLVAAWIGGWERAPYFVSPLAALACILMMYVVGRELGLSAALSLAAAALLAVLPQFTAHAVQPVSDVVATFWSLIAIWAALVALRKPNYAILAGVAFAIGVWVRPTNVLLISPLAIAVQLRVRLLIRIAIAALPLAVALMDYHYRTYGGVFTTGYGKMSIVFSTGRFREVFAVFVKWFSRVAPIVFPLGLLVAFDRRLGRWHRLLLPVWFLVFFLMYCFWAPYDDWWSLRFLLPGTPALIFGMLFLIRDTLLVRHAKWIHAVAGLLIIVLIAIPAYRNRQYGVELTDHWESIYPEAVRWAEQRMEPDSMLISGSLSGAFFYYADRWSVRPDQLTDDHFQELRGYAGKRRWYAVLSDGEPEFHSLAEKLRGHWTLVGSHRHVSMWKLDD